MFDLMGGGCTILTVQAAKLEYCFSGFPGDFLGFLWRNPRSNKSDDNEHRSDSRQVNDNDNDNDILAMDGLKNKKFKLSDLPLSTAQRQSIDSLLFSFKKKGEFDSVRRKIWDEFNNSVCPMSHLRNKQ